MTEPGGAKTFWSFAFKAMIAHTLTYFAFGLVMSTLFHYGQLFQKEIIRDFMRPIDSPYVMAGPFLQPIRGLFFAVAIWPIRKFLLLSKFGWLILWNIVVFIGILSTPAAAPCSMEGIIYSKLPLWYHLIGLPEILLQTLAFSLWLIWWERRSQKVPEEKFSAESSTLAEVVKAVMTACFAYIGYAIGGLLSAALVIATSPAGSPGIDIKAAGANVKIQMMFVVAFVVNVFAVFFIARKWVAGGISMVRMFLIFLFIETVVPWIYQIVFTSRPPAHLALLLGLFPAAIIALSLRLNYRKAARAASNPEVSAG